MAELNVCDRDHMATKPKYLLEPLQRKFPTLLCATAEDSLLIIYDIQFLKKKLEIK